MYIDYDDVVERYPMLKTTIGNAPALDNDITYAEHELNSRLATHFSVPFSGPHPTIMDICIDLTYYRQIRIKDPDLAEKFKEGILGRIQGLKDSKEYIITDSNTTITVNATGGNEIWSTVQDYEPTFSMLDADNTYSRVDSSRLYDEEQARK